MYQNEFFKNLFSGQVKPVTIPKFKSPPVYQKRIKIHESDRYFTSIKIWVHSPRFEYPKSTIFLGLQKRR